MLSHAEVTTSPAAVVTHPRCHHSLPPLRRMQGYCRPNGKRSFGNSFCRVTAGECQRNRARRAESRTDRAKQAGFPVRRGITLRNEQRGPYTGAEREIPCTDRAKRAENRNDLARRASRQRRPCKTSRELQRACIPNGKRTGFPKAQRAIRHGAKGRRTPPHPEVTTSRAPVVTCRDDNITRACCHAKGPAARAAPSRGRAQQGLVADAASQLILVAARVDGQRHADDGGPGEELMQFHRRVPPLGLLGRARRARAEAASRSGP